MKFTVLTTLLAATAASSLQEQDGALGIGFLTGYDLVFLKCQAGVSTTKEDGTIEKSAVIFRLCPVGEACTTKKSMSCTSGYGDFMTGLTRFAQAFLDTYHRSYGEDNQQHINWADFGECRQFNASKYAEGGIYAGGGAVDEDVQYFVGPACTNAGTSIRLALYTDEYCSVESDVISFRDITGDDLLYESGGMAGVGQCQWYQCYGKNESGYPAWYDLCVQNVEHTIAKCETYMDGLLTYAEEQGISYTKDESGCSTIAQYYKASKNGGNGVSGGGGLFEVGQTFPKVQGISYSKDESGSSTIAQYYKASKNSSSGCGMSRVGKTFLILGIAVVVIGIAFFVFAKQRRKEGAPVEYLKVSPAERLE
jgi:hypothetical protein